MKALTITSDKMSTLTEDEIKMLMMLGVPIKEKTKQPRSASAIPKEYDLVITKVCRLCGHSDIKMYRMTVDWTLKGLVSIEVDKVSDKYKTKNYHVRCCGYCRDYLKTKSIDDVVEILMRELEDRFLS
jgi:hypothetical protein